MHTEVICRYCRGTIDDPTSARYKNGGVFHDNCYDEVQANLENLNNVLDQFETLNKIEVTLDNDLLKQDGLLHDEEKFSDEAWFEEIESSMKSSNAEISTLSIDLTRKDKKTGEFKPTGKTATIKIYRENKLDGDVFTYSYWRSVLPFIGGMSFWMKIKVVYHYIFNTSIDGRAARDMIQSELRRLFWKCTPDWKKWKEMQDQ